MEGGCFNLTHGLLTGENPDASKRPAKSPNPHDDKFLSKTFNWLFDERKSTGFSESAPFLIRRIGQAMSGTAKPPKGILDIVRAMPPLFVRGTYISVSGPAGFRHAAFFVVLGYGLKTSPVAQR